MLLKDYIAQKRAGLIHGGRFSRRTMKKMRKRLSRARLGYFVGEGTKKRFVPLNKKEHDIFLQMMRTGSIEDLETAQGMVEIDESSFVQNAPKNKFGFQGWHTPYLKRPGLLHDWWAKGVRIKFRAKAYAKMVHWCQAVDTECSGLGKTLEHKDADGKITMIEVLDVMLFEQECTSGYTEISEEALQKFLFQLAKANENPGKWKLWWHTHNDFGVFWSGVDDANVTRLITTFGSYLVSTCVNKNCDIIGRIDELKDGKELSADCEVNVVPIRNNNLKAKCVRQAKRLVKKKVYVHTPYVYQGSTYTPGGSFKGFSKRDADKLGGSDYDPFFALRQHGRMPLPSVRAAALGNAMSNADRRRQGIPQDPDLPDFLIGYGEMGRRSSEHNQPQPFFINE